MPIWCASARKAVAEQARQYLGAVTWTAQIPVEQSFAYAALIVAGLAADASFSFNLSWTGQYSLPDAGHYTAAGSGAVTARIYLDAYSYFEALSHPVLPLQALAARVAEKVAKNNVEIGGVISMVALHRDLSDEHPDRCEEFDSTDPKIRAAIEHWELLEGGVAESIRTIGA